MNTPADDMPTTTHAGPAQPPADDTAAQAYCRNCNAPLLGPHCYACGQPVSGLVRPLGNLFGDLMDSVFNIDARILRTLGPLVAKPGVLTNEYFAGHQIPYVTPVRLFFFLCILAFFVARFALDGTDAVKFDAGEGQTSKIGAAMSEAQVIARRDAVLERLAKAKTAIPDGPGRRGAASGIESGELQARRAADARIKLLRDAAAKGLPPPPPIDDDFSLNGTPWNETSNPVHVAGAPRFVDAWVNHKIGRAKHNVTRIKAEPAQYADAFIGSIPTALFVLVPIFALMLKLAYLFKRRLYMEHLVVALHSHAFLSMDLLLVFACIALQRAVPVNGALDNLLEICTGLLVAWVPVYLLLMQKRVYRQDWPMTLLKFFVLGACYMMLLGFAISAAAVASLVWL